jgi:Yip1 domain
MADEAAADIWVDSWFTIWYAPRATIRRIVDADPHKFVIGLAFAAGALASLYSLLNPSANAHLPHFGPIGVALGVILSGVASIVSLYGLAALYRWSGGVLGGTATRVEMRSALAWAQVPGLYLQMVNIITAALGFDSTTVASSVSPYGIVESLIGLWVFVILLKCIGEVHHFSAWRALGAIVVGTLAMLAVLAGIVATIWPAVRVIHPFS